MGYRTVYKSFSCRSARCRSTVLATVPAGLQWKLFSGVSGHGAALLYNLHSRPQGHDDIRQISGESAVYNCRTRTASQFDEPQSLLLVPYLEVADYGIVYEMMDRLYPGWENDEPMKKLSVPFNLVNSASPSRRAGGFPDQQRHNSLRSSTEIICVGSPQSADQTRPHRQIRKFASAILVVDVGQRLMRSSIFWIVVGLDRPHRSVTPR